MNTSKTQDDIRDRLISLRHSLKISTSELAKKMGCWNTTVCRLESREHSPTLDTLMSWCAALGVKLSLKIED